MRDVLWLGAAAGAAWWLGRRAGERALDRRLSDLEQRLRSDFAPHPAFAAPAPAPVEALADIDEIPPETISVIAAAVAAFLGKRARIRRVRRVNAAGFNPWSQQGRVSVQASHNLAFSRRGE